MQNKTHGNKPFHKTPSDMANRCKMYLMCCGVLQCVAMCCNVLRCVAMCCSALQCVAVCCNVLQCVAMCCSVWHCVAVFYLASIRHTCMKHHPLKRKTNSHKRTATSLCTKHTISTQYILYVFTKDASSIHMYIDLHHKQGSRQEAFPQSTETLISDGLDETVKHSRVCSRRFARHNSRLEHIGCVRIHSYIHIELYTYVCIYIHIYVNI